MKAHRRTVKKVCWKCDPERGNRWPVPESIFLELCDMHERQVFGPQGDVHRPRRPGDRVFVCEPIHPTLF